MKKIYVFAFISLFALSASAQDKGKSSMDPLNNQPKGTPQKQQPAPKEIDPEIKELMAVRDSAKSTLRSKTSENKKDINHYDRMYNKNKTMKEQAKTAQKGKKTDKADELNEKISLTTDSLKELDAKIKADMKDLKNLQKDLDKAEVDLEKAKERIAKEKKKK